jgi:hypothetical protein
VTDSQSDRWRQIERLYNEASEMDAAQREAFLARACVGDEVLRQQVRSLLVYERAADSFLERSALAEAALSSHVGPVLLVRLLDPEIRRPAPLSPGELDDLVAFVRDGLHDARVNAISLCQLVPAAVPSGRPVLEFERCR